MTSFRCTVALVVVMAAAALQASAMSPMRTTMPTPATTPPPPPPPTTTPPPPTTARACVMGDGSPFQGDIEPGQFQESSDGCTGCYCDESSMIVYCFSASCAPPLCHDSVKKPGVCCDECPNGPNCKTPGGILLRDGQSVIENNMYCMCSTLYGMQYSSEGPQALCNPLFSPTTPPPSGCAFTNGTVVAGTKPGDDLQLDPCTTCFCTDGYVLQCVDEACPAPECSDYFTPQGQCCPRCP
ncbi:cysteine-rich motor neuron 1 protein-like [Littorina saxatilis]|uniref:VWFC domain-containing protein n=1 Tax=Littorina saxatilis TaxID=31220 RepID=A0AAN9BRG4_9CAEN